MTDETMPGPEMGDAGTPKSKRLMPPDWNEAEDGEWDDEYASEKALAEGADLELVVEYLNKHLDPERTEQVRRRLEEDEAFRELAAPLLLTWSLPKHLERYPRPAGELEKDWDEFTKRAGFAHQRRKVRRRRLWLLGLVFFVVGAGLVGFRRPLSEWYVTLRHYAAVPLDGRDGWIPLGDSVFVDPAPGASVRARTEPLDERLHLILDGEARFLVSRRDSTQPTPFHRGLVVRTRAGTVSTEEAEFTVTARSDSTIVEVHRPSIRTYDLFFPRPTVVDLWREDPDTGEPLRLRELGRARLVRGKDQHPTRLPPAKDPDDADPFP